MIGFLTPIVRVAVEAGEIAAKGFPWMSCQIWEECPEPPSGCHFSSFIQKSSMFTHILLRLGFGGNALTKVLGTS